MNAIPTNKFKLNVIFGFINSIVSVIQTFWFIPYIKDYLGTAAYGYISVINGLANTLFVLASAIGAMGTRFILVTLERDSDREANEYFNSELFAMIAGSILLICLAIVLSMNLGLIMNVNQRFYREVQILLLLTINSLILQLLSSPFSASFFFKNTIYITYIIYIIDYLGRIILTVLMFHHNAKVLWSASLSTNIVYLFGLLFYVYYSKRSIPVLKINSSKFSIKELLELIRSGMWIAISSAGNMMLSSLNTYFANILCGVFITGIYASVMQFNTIESMVLSVLVNSLLPKMFKLFSHEDSNNLFLYTVYSMTLTALFLGVVSGGIIVYGNDFMRIWMGNKFTGYFLLIFLTVVYLPFTLPSQVLNQTFTVMNRVMIPAILTIITGLLNIVLAIFLTNVVHLNIYGVALSSLLIQFIRDCIIYPYYFYKISPYFDKKIYIPFIAAFFSISTTVCVCILIKIMINPTSILLFVGSIGLAGLLSLIIVFGFLKFISNKLVIDTR